ncbi:MAG: sulfotransferase family protein [Calditrichia bacterium]
MKCILLFSDKSSGSSALQRALVKHPDLNTVKKTRHFYSETLYWNKAVAVLGLDQAEMEYSELPMARKKAREDIVALLNDNLPVYETPSDDQVLILDGWQKLCEQFAPIFFEKSPHHLHYRSGLDLILKFDQQHPDIEFRYIGLVRNPIDALYSMWQRWSAVPERRQFEWLRAHQNLQYLGERAGEKLLTIRYEDITAGPESMKQICKFIGVEWSPEIGSDLHRKSVQKWRSDKTFGFQPDDDVLAMARSLGYREAEMKTTHSFIWPIIRNLNELNFRFASGFKQIKQQIRGR